MMNKILATKLAKEETITYGDLKEILRQARKYITDWNRTGCSNPTFSKGACFNIFAKSVREQKDDRIDRLGLLSRNILREFGEFSKFGDRKLPRKQKYTGKVHHEEPIEIDF